MFASRNFAQKWFEPVPDSLLTNCAFSAHARPTCEILKDHDSGLDINCCLPSGTWVTIFESLLINGCVVDLIPMLGNKMFAAVRAEVPYVGVESSSKRYDKIVHVLPQLFLQSLQHHKPSCF